MRASEQSEEASSPVSLKAPLSLCLLLVQSLEVLSWGLFLYSSEGELSNSPSLQWHLSPSVGWLMCSAPGPALGTGDVAVNKTDTVTVELIFYCSGERQSANRMRSAKGQKKVKQGERRMGRVQRCWLRERWWPQISFLSQRSFLRFRLAHPNYLLGICAWKSHRHKIHHTHHGSPPSSKFSSPVEPSTQTPRSDTRWHP